MPTAEVAASSGTSVLCIRSNESAGHMVVCVVTSGGWTPGATVLGWRDYLLPPPTIIFKSRRQIPYIVMVFFLCVVTGASVFWDFGSLYLEASRRPSGQLLWQRQTQPTVAAAASPASTTLRRQRAETSVENGVSLIDSIQRSFVQSFIWQLARMLSRSCPCSLSCRLSCDRVTQRRGLTKAHGAFALR